MKFLFGVLILFLVILTSCSTHPLRKDYRTSTLEIEPVTKNVWLHTSFLQTRDFGKVGCNGMIVARQGEAIILDTPVDDASSEELIRWVETRLAVKIKGVVITHFHNDCLGGLAVFHERNIPSYANERTLALTREKKLISPLQGFSREMELAVGRSKLELYYPGEGHTTDNIIGYFSDDQTLFGGCLIKSLDAGKGNLEDANVSAWSNTVREVLRRFPDVKIVIPGHGEYGDRELLHYTIRKFEEDQR